MVNKIREVRPKWWGRLWREGFMEKVCLSLEWNRDGVMRGESLVDQEMQKFIVTQHFHQKIN